LLNEKYKLIPIFQPVSSGHHQGKKNENENEN